ncbi:MAG: hypothetical protein Q8908_10425 [Bacteroidota bacterium]|nr:hypothetical protein [Bacteroidota bacterium]
MEKWAKTRYDVAMRPHWPFKQLHSGVGTADSRFKLGLAIKPVLKIRNACAIGGNLSWEA